MFAPTNEAFDKINSDVLERIMGDKTVLKGKLSRTYCKDGPQCLGGMHLTNKKLSLTHGDSIGSKPVGAAFMGYIGDRRHNKPWEI